MMTKIIIKKDIIKGKSLFNRRGRKDIFRCAADVRNAKVAKSERLKIAGFFKNLHKGAQRKHREPQSKERLVFKSPLGELGHSRQPNVLNTVK